MVGVGVFVGVGEFVGVCVGVFVDVGVGVTVYIHSALTINLTVSELTAVLSTPIITKDGLSSYLFTFVS